MNQLKSHQLLKVIAGPHKGFGLKTVAYLINKDFKPSSSAGAVVGATFDRDTRSPDHLVYASFINTPIKVTVRGDSTKNQLILKTNGDIEIPIDIQDSVSTLRLEEGDYWAMIKTNLQASFLVLGANEGIKLCDYGDLCSDWVDGKLKELRASLSEIEPSNQSQKKKITKLLKGLKTVAKGDECISKVVEYDKALRDLLSKVRKKESSTSPDTELSSLELFTLKVTTIKEALSRLTPTTERLSTTKERLMTELDALENTPALTWAKSEEKILQDLDALSDSVSILSGKIDTNRYYTALDKLESTIKGSSVSESISKPYLDKLNAARDSGTPSESVINNLSVELKKILETYNKTSYANASSAPENPGSERNSTSSVEFRSASPVEAPSPKEPSNEDAAIENPEEKEDDTRASIAENKTELESEFKKIQGSVPTPNKTQRKAIRVVTELLAKAESQEDLDEITRKLNGLKESIKATERASQAASKTAVAAAKDDAWGPTDETRAAAAVRYFETLTRETKTAGKNDPTPATIYIDTLSADQKELAENVYKEKPRYIEFKIVTTGKKGRQKTRLWCKDDRDPRQDKWVSLHTYVKEILLGGHIKDYLGRLLWGTSAKGLTYIEHMKDILNTAIESRNIKTDEIIAGMGYMVTSAHEYTEDLGKRLGWIYSGASIPSCNTLKTYDDLMQDYIKDLLGLLLREMDLGEDVTQDCRYLLGLYNTLKQLESVNLNEFTGLDLSWMSGAMGKKPEILEMVIILMGILDGKGKLRQCMGYIETESSRKSLIIFDSNLKKNTLSVERRDGSPEEKTTVTMFLKETLDQLKDTVRAGNDISAVITGCMQLGSHLMRKYPQDRNARQLAFSLFRIWSLRGTDKLEALQAYNQALTEKWGSELSTVIQDITALSMTVLKNQVVQDTFYGLMSTAYLRIIFGQESLATREGLLKVFAHYIPSTRVENVYSRVKDDLIRAITSLPAKEEEGCPFEQWGLELTPNNGEVSQIRTEGGDALEPVRKTINQLLVLAHDYQELRKWADLELKISDDERPLKAVYKGLIKKAIEIMSSAGLEINLIKFRFLVNALACINPDDALVDEIGEFATSIEELIKNLYIKEKGQVDDPLTEQEQEVINTYEIELQSLWGSISTLCLSKVKKKLVLSSVRELDKQLKDNSNAS